LTGTRKRQRFPSLRFRTGRADPEREALRLLSVRPDSRRRRIWRPPNGGGFGGIPIRFRLFSRICREEKFPSLPAGAARPTSGPSRSPRRTFGRPRAAMRRPTSGALLGREASAICDSRPRVVDDSARQRLLACSVGFWESLATADSRHRRSKEENSMTPDFQKQNLANFEVRSADALSDQAASVVSFPHKRESRAPARAAKSGCPLSRA
jgi:hypothetical protein